jgi:hypothetical protein
MKNENKLPFFIFGTKRGGTTLLRVMLNGHPNLCIPAESHFLIPIFKNFKNFDKEISENDLNQIKNHILHGGRFHTWKTNEDEIKELFADTKGKHFKLRDIVSSVFELEKSKYKKEIWGDKTPEYTLFIPQINKLYPKHLAIGLIRDGRDVSFSLKNRGWEGWTIYQRAKYWKKCINNIHNTHKERPDHTIIVKYENLVQNTEEIISRLSYFLQVKYMSSMLDYTNRASDDITETEKEKEIHHKLSRKPSPEKDISKWKREQKSIDILLFESVAHKELTKMGYEVAVFNYSNPLHFLLKIFYGFFGEFLIILYSLYHNERMAFYSKKIKSISFFKWLRTKIRNA